MDADWAPDMVGCTWIEVLRMSLTVQNSTSLAQYSRGSHFRAGWRRYLRAGLPAPALGWLIVLAVVALFGPRLAPYPLMGNLMAANQPPSLIHPFGTNNIGQDMLTLCMYGVRYTFAIAAGATAVAFCIGVGLGLLAGMAGGAVDEALMRVTDFMYSFPSFVVAVLLIQISGQGAIAIAAVLGVTQWAGFARLARGLVLSVRRSDLVESGRAIGASSFFITMRYVFPHVTYNIIVYTAFFAANAITLEAMLSIFTNTGPAPPAVSFGELMLTSIPNVLGFPWLLVMPVLVFISILIALVSVGEGLQAALSPKGLTTF